MFPPPLHRICRVSIRPTDIGRDGRRMVMETASIYPFNVSPPPWRERASFSSPSLGNDVSGMVRSFAPLASMHTDPKIEWRNTEPLGANEAVVSG